MTTTHDHDLSFDWAETKLAESLPGYESRPQQRALARAVEEAIANGTHLIAEAGTGCGKSFATAIPAILAGKRVVMSTATKALQDQLAGKDMPFLAEHLGVPFTYALLKGRSNYVCKAAAYSDAAETAVTINDIRARFTDPMFNGERDNLGFEIENRDWLNVTVSSDECPGKSKCPFGPECYAEAAKAAAQQADVVIVNHALLLIELKLKMVTDGVASMLGEFDTVIIDEAHEFEDYAVSTFSTRLTQFGFTQMVGEVRNWVRRFGLNESIVAVGDRVLGAVVGLWDLLEEGRIRPAHIAENEEAWFQLAIALKDFHKAIYEADLGMSSSYEQARITKERLSRRVGNTSVSIIDIATAAGDELVRWVEMETDRRNNKHKTLKSAPIDVSHILRGALFEQTPAILVSATMAVDGTFDYIAGRLGVDEYDGLNVGSPFDFAVNTRLYVPRDLPAPTPEKRAAWSSMAAQRTLELVRASQGRALLLFTSIKQMRETYDAIADRIDYKVMMQGDAPNKKLAAEFKSDTSSVLFATRSFFTGIDLPGDTLSLVVIDKLPFSPPNDPMVEARTELIESKGGDSFKDFTIPVMSLILAQGFGRLIRTTSDAGVVAILDSRLVTKGYGAKIRRSLPDAPVVETMAEVEEFFAELEAVR